MSLFLLPCSLVRARDRVSFGQEAKLGFLLEQETARRAIFSGPCVVQPILTDVCICGCDYADLITHLYIFGNFEAEGAIELRLVIILIHDGNEDSSPTWKVKKESMK